MLSRGRDNLSRCESVRQEDYTVIKFSVSVVPRSELSADHVLIGSGRIQLDADMFVLFVDLRPDIMSVEYEARIAVPWRPARPRKSLDDLRYIIAHLISRMRMEHGDDTAMIVTFEDGWREEIEALRPLSKRIWDKLFRL